MKEWALSKVLLSSYQIIKPPTLRPMKNLKGQVAVLLIVRDDGVGKERGFLRI